MTVLRADKISAQAVVVIFSMLFLILWTFFEICKLDTAFISVQILQTTNKFASESILLIARPEDSLLAFTNAFVLISHIIRSAKTRTKQRM